MKTQYDSMADKNVINEMLPKAPKGKRSDRNVHGSHQGDNAVRCERGC